MSDLAEALKSSSRIVEEALQQAREELAQLNQRKAELEVLIAQAEAMQRSRSLGTPPARSLTLHEAIAEILREQNNIWMSPREIADAVNGRGLYTKKDGTLVEVSQIHARTKNYAQMFEKEGSKIRLRNPQGEIR
jgi:hypothetical protein